MRQQRQPANPQTGAPVYAALDLGTNNCRLLVVRPSERGFDVVDSFSRIVRLGEGLQITGRLSEKAIERTIRALHICAGKIRRRRVTRVRSVATDACRRAANCAGFVERVKRETGVRLEIIGAREEAALAAAGCEPLLDPARRRALVFDIGGGSTELMWLAVTGEGRARLLDSISLPWGVARMAETFGSDRISDRAYKAMTEAVAPWLRRFDEANGISAAVAAGEVQMLGTSGPVTIVAGLHLGLARYRRDLVDGCTLAFDDLDAVSDHAAPAGPGGEGAAALHRARARRHGGRRLRHTGGDLPDVARRLGPGRRPGGARGHPVPHDRERRRGGVSRPPRARPGRQAGLKARLRTAKGRKTASTRWLQRQLSDSYVAEAKRLGLRSRAAFKLMQLDDRFRLLKPGGAVLDLGAAPGGWTQVAVARGAGAVVAADLQAMEPVPGACCLLLDLGDSDAPARLGAALPDGADLVLSDMAPRTTGHAATDRLRIVALAELAYEGRAGVAAAGRRPGCQGFSRGCAPGVAECVEAGFRLCAPCEAGCEPQGVLGALPRGDGISRLRRLRLHIPAEAGIRRRQPR